jgi:rsbT antagonist protein RsbS
MQLVYGCVVASIQVDLSDEVLHLFQQDLLEQVRQSRAGAAILDLAGAAVLDAADFRSIVRTLMMARLLGAVPVIVGLRPGIAASLAELGADADAVLTVPTLQHAFERVQRRSI